MTDPAPEPPGKPPGIQAVTVIALVLAGWELLSCLGAVNTDVPPDPLEQLVAERMPTAHKAPPEARAELARIRAAIAGAATPREAYLLTALTAPVAIATLIAAILLNQGKRRSDVWFVRAVTALAVVQALRLANDLRMNGPIRPMLAEFLATSASANKMDPAQLARVSDRLTGYFALACTIVAVVLTTAKLLACLYARQQARKPAVRAWTALDFEPHLSVRP